MIQLTLFQPEAEAFLEAVAPKKEACRQLPIEVIEHPRRKTATGQVRSGKIQIVIPKKWPRAFKESVILELASGLQEKFQKDNALRLAVTEREPLITVSTPVALTALVTALNEQTFSVPLSRVKIGTARYTRMAQMNIQTREMTISRYCLQAVPEAALRYLIVHELAHLLERNHSKRFWALVAQYVPDYRKQREIIRVFHTHAVEQEACSKPMAHSSSF